MLAPRDGVELGDPSGVACRDPLGGARQALRDKRPLELGTAHGRECAIGTNPLLADMAHVGACAASVGMGDAEPDGIQDAWEVCKWGTSPSNPDSDGDGRSDCIEVLDVNGNGVANAADATLIVRAASLIDIGDLAAEDINGNGLVNVADRTLLLRLITGIDPSGGLCM